MPVAGIVHLIIHAILWGIYYSILIREFVPMEKKNRIVCYGIVAVISFLAEYTNYRIPEEDTILICMNEAKSIVTESSIIIMICLVCTDNPWRSYAHVVEANLFYVLLQILFSGFSTAMYHYDQQLANIKSFMEWQPNGKMLLIIFFTILIERLLQKYKLFGRIPYQLWIGYVSLSMIVALIDAIVNFLGMKGFEKSSKYAVLGAVVVLPFFLSSAALLYKLRIHCKQQNNQTELDLKRQLKYYESLQNQQKFIRELRHDLQNYLETLQYVSGESDKEKEYQQQFIDKIKEMGGKRKE